MIDQNGIIQKPVSISDIQKVLVTDESDLGTLCLNQNINLLSKYKPRVSNNAFGYWIPSLEYPDNVLNYVDNSQIPLSYNIPENSIGNIWKYIIPDKFYLEDFNYYNHNANGNLLNGKIIINNIEYNFEDSIELDRNNTLYVEVTNGNFSLKDFQALKDYYFGVIININNNYIITQENTIKNLESYNLNINLKTLPTGTGKLLPIISSENFSTLTQFNDRIIIPIIWKSSSIEVIGEYNLNIVNNFKDHELVNNIYNVNIEISNIGSDTEIVVMKNISAGINSLYTGLRVISPSLLDEDMGESIHVNETKNYTIIINSNNEKVNLRYSLYKKVENENNPNEYTLTFIGTYTYNINNSLEPSLETYFLGQDTSGVLNPKNLFELTGGGLVLILPIGKNYGNLELERVENTNNTNIISIDDWTYAFGRNIGWTGGNNLGHYNEKLKIYSSVDTNLSRTFTIKSTLDELETYLFYKEQISKVIRIPYSGGSGKITLNIYPYTFDEYDTYKVNTIRVYQPWEDQIYRELNEEDFIQATINDGEDYLYQELNYSCNTVNNTNNYKYLCLLFGRALTFIQEPFNKNRIYFGKDFGKNYLQDDYNYIFSSVNSKVLNEESFEIKVSKTQYKLCFPNDFDYDVRFINNNIEYNVSIIEDNYMWGTQSYKIVSPNYNSKIVFTKK